MYSLPLGTSISQNLWTPFSRAADCNATASQLCLTPKAKAGIAWLKVRFEASLPVHINVLNGRHVRPLAGRPTPTPINVTPTLNPTPQPAPTNPTASGPYPGPHPTPQPKPTPIPQNAPNVGCTGFHLLYLRNKPTIVILVPSHSSFTVALLCSCHSPSASLSYPQFRGLLAKIINDCTRDSLPSLGDVRVSEPSFLTDSS
ncbi:hypothetical protein Mapa_009428 [Marchantia paleacea]|nr:hypothetical protein Mapa_009428 [Marchantia paleacea]